MICFGPFLLNFKSAAIAQPILEKYLFMALFTLKSLIEITDRSRTHQAGGLHIIINLSGIVAHFAVLNGEFGRLKCIFSLLK